MRSFLVIADTLSLSRAAETVGRSTSTVSQQITKLESQTGKGLLARRKGQVLKLTRDGERFSHYARRILQLSDEAYASMREDALTGLVRVGVPLDFFGRDFMAWLARFKSMNPMVAIEVEVDQSEILMKRSARGELDLAFFKQDTGANYGTAILQEQLVWVGGPCDVDETNSIPLVLFPEGCAYRSIAVAALKAHGRAWHGSFVSPSLECLKAAITEGIGITILAKSLVESPLRIVRHDMWLPQLPTVELAYAARGWRSNSHTVGELTSFLVDRLIQATRPMRDEKADRPTFSRTARIESSPAL